VNFDIYDLLTWYLIKRYIFVKLYTLKITGTCFIQKIYAPSSSLLQGKHLLFTPSPLRLNIFRLFVILSLTQLYRYTPEIFLFSTATFKYKYRVHFLKILFICFNTCSILSLHNVLTFEYLASYIVIEISFKDPFNLW
jgi:hypothetical protein